MLVIDGFDDLLRRGNLQYDALGALVFEVNRLNMEFADAKLPVKIIVLCRTDLFERLPGANKNKIRQNAAVHIDWTCDMRDPKSSKLIALINRRASLTVHQDIDVFQTYLPVGLGSHSSGNIRAQLLEHTRQLPRDTVMLFKSLQEHSGDGAMSDTQVFNALTAYSRDYLLPEIKDELDGYIDGDHIKAIFQLFGSVRKISPPISELERPPDGLRLPAGFNLENILSVLFECSGIGNLVPAHAGKAQYSTFKHRSRHTTFNPEQQIIIQQGLWRALNLRW